MGLEDLLSLTQKAFQKKYNKDRSLEIDYGDQVTPATGLVVDNPLLEYVLDRRFIAYGRCYLIYGKKGCSKTSLFLNFAKMFQQAGGDVIWIETEKAADLDYAKKQGVDLKRMVIPKVDTLQEALTVAEDFIKNLPKAYPDGDTPVIICLDSIAGAIPEYEMQTDVKVGETKIGEHARLMSGFYRRITHPLFHEKAIFVALNQLKVKIGGMAFGGEDPEAMIGGEAPRFHSTYQFKMDLIQQLGKKEAGTNVERKIGSRHKITCKRNKLGREGKSQNVEFDLFIEGGIDWFGSLVRKLGTEYPAIVDKSGAFYSWVPENTVHKVELVEEVDESGNKKHVPTPVLISTEKSYRERELAQIISESAEAREIIRKAFGIPDMPPPSVVEQVEKENKVKRKRSKKILEEEDADSLTE